MVHDGRVWQSCEDASTPRTESAGQRGERWARPLQGKRALAPARRQRDPRRGRGTRTMVSQIPVGSWASTTQRLPLHSCSLTRPDGLRASPKRRVWLHGGRNSYDLTGHPPAAEPDPHHSCLGRPAEGTGTVGQRHNQSNRVGSKEQPAGQRDFHRDLPGGCGQSEPPALYAVGCGNQEHCLQPG